MREGCIVLLGLADTWLMRRAVCAQALLLLLLLLAALASTAAVAPPKRAAAAACNCDHESSRCKLLEAVPLRIVSLLQGLDQIRGCEMLGTGHSTGMGLRGDTTDVCKRIECVWKGRVILSSE